MRRAAALSLGLLLAACETPSPEPVLARADTLALPAAFAARLDSARLDPRVLDADGDAYALVDVEADSGRVLVQYVDLGQAVVSQVLGPAEDSDAGGGRFHPTAPSPFVRSLDVAEVVRQQTADERLLAVLNGAFFETPGARTTQIAYPIAERGRVVTGGSSPYGPGRPGAERARWGQPLRALALADTLAHIETYDPATEAPLDRPAFAEALVSLAPEAHPSRIATRFHVLGTLDADGDGATESLLIATSDGATTIETPSRLLARLGVASERQIALDGGASVLVWNRRAGTLHRPAPAGGRDPQRLPHLLTVRLR